MIQIVNISKEPKPFGIQEYSLRINHEEMLRFEHKREDGLGMCLLAAAKAVEKQKWSDLERLFRDATLFGRE